MSVYVLQISHRFGHNVTVHKTEDGARLELLEFVNNWWDEEMPADLAKPDSADEIIETYFYNIQDGENWDIDETEILP